ncbi:MAG: family transcriptional regulator [Bradyrhizobium sp.]|nr:family transcriptional regulator [Bradyrhizobium sp.]
MLRRKELHLIGRRRMTTANGAQLEPSDYNGFRIEFADGPAKVFLKLHGADAEHDAFEVTAEVADGAFIVGERDELSEG